MILQEQCIKLLEYPNFSEWPHALICGYRNDYFRILWETSFQKLGLIHILVVSGLHVRILVVGVRWLLKFWPSTVCSLHVKTKFSSFIFWLIISMLHLTMSGFGPSTLRAWIEFHVQQLRLPLTLTLSSLVALVLDAIWHGGNPSLSILLSVAARSALMWGTGAGYFSQLILIWFFVSLWVTTSPPILLYLQMLLLPLITLNIVAETFLLLSLKIFGPLAALLSFKLFWVEHGLRSILEQLMSSLFLSYGSHDPIVFYPLGANYTAILVGCLITASFYGETYFLRKKRFSFLRSKTSGNLLRLSFIATLFLSPHFLHFA